MQHTFLIQVFQVIQPDEYFRVRQWLESPFHNRRTDVLRLFNWLVQQQNKQGDFAATAAYEAVYEGEVYHAAQFHLVSRYLLDLLEQYLAYQNWAEEPLQQRLHLLKALRSRKAADHFERHARRIESAQAERSERHADFHLLEYQLQKEIFEYRIVRQRNWQLNLSAILTALGQFFTLETLRWTGFTAAFSARSGTQLPQPVLRDAVLSQIEQVDQPDWIQLQYQAAQIALQPDNEEAFESLCAVLPAADGLFPASQHRDLYMTAINYCIRKQNRGDRSFVAKALALYRQALEKGVLLEQGLLAQYTYHNIHALAHLAGETEWAAQFLEQYRHCLPEALRENTYRYNLAILYFRQRDYVRTLELLRTIETPQTVEQIEIRRMLLRVYYELGEWSALGSLLDSFKAILMRKKDLGYLQASYLNLIKFTHQLVKTRLAHKSKRLALAQKIEQTQQVAEREWLLEQLNKTS
jgi:hypothetical protein